jgi:hypothetical protein
MTQHSKQDGTTAAQRGTGARPSFPSKLPTSANDNDCEGPWPLNPLPEELNGISFQVDSKELIKRVSTESARPSFLFEEATAQAVQTSCRSSWRGTLGRVTYAVVVSIAMFGWLYLLWRASVSGVQMMLSGLSGSANFL